MGKILLEKKLILANHFDISIVLEISVEDKFNCIIVLFSQVIIENDNNVE